MVWGCPVQARRTAGQHRVLKQAQKGAESNLVVIFLNLFLEYSGFSLRYSIL